MTCPDLIINGEKYFTRPTLAKILGKSPATLAIWKTQGRGPRCINIGRKVIYSEKEVISWLEGLSSDDSDNGGWLKSL